MKKIAVSILLFGILINLFAQDTFVFRDRTEKETIVKKIVVTTIEYLRYYNQEGAIYEVLKNDVLRVNYKNGAVNEFEFTEAPYSHPKGILGTFVDKVIEIFPLDNEYINDQKYLISGSCV